MTSQENVHPGPVRDQPAMEELHRLHAERETALQAARSAVRDTTRLTRLLAILGEPGPMDLLFDRTLSTLSELFAADIVVLLDPAGTGTFAPLAAIGLPEDLLPLPFFDQEDSYAMQVMARREPVLVDHAGTDPRIASSLRELEVMTMIGLPVIGSQGVRGALFLARCRPAPFATSEADLLGSMTYRIGLTLEEAQRADQSSRLVECNRLISRHLNPTLVATEAVQLFPAMAGADAAALVLVSSETGPSCAGLSGLEWGCAPVLVGLASRLLAAPSQDEPYATVALPAMLGAFGFSPWADCPQSLLALPFGRKERNRGMLFALRRTAVAFTPIAQQMATLYADQIAAALENSRLYQAVHSELAERVRAEEALRASEERFRALVRSVSDIIAILDREGAIHYISPAAEILWECPAMALYGQNILDRVHPQDLAGLHELLARVGARAGEMVQGAVRLAREGEDWRDFDCILVNLLDDPAIDGLVVTFHDVTERRTYERRLTQLAYFDPLTGLANRACFYDRMRSALARACTEGLSVAVLFADLDNFKIINDTLGHAYGDEALRWVADQLRANLAHGELAARLGGDEFTVLIEGVRGVEQVLPLAHRLIAALAAPVRLAGRDFRVGGSMGLAINDPGNPNADELLRKADLAMYRAKQEGKGRCVVFRADLDETSRERLEMEAELRRAIGRKEFFLRFQPIFDLDTRQVQAVEALVFWQHPRRGEVAPTVIIPLAEESGCMVELGQWIVREACRQSRAWSPRGVRHGGIPVCVNLSPGQFHHPSLAVDTAAALEQEDLSPAQLVFEIAESTLAHEPAGALNRFAALKNIGVRLTIDDFGTGHLDLHVLKHLPVEALKIDHTFIRDVETDERKQAIVRGVLALAGDCGLRVVGEGIETQAQLDQLLRMGCACGQGYLLARPMSAMDCAALLARQH